MSTQSYNQCSGEYSIKPGLGCVSVRHVICLCDPLPEIPQTDQCPVSFQSLDQCPVSIQRSMPCEYAIIIMVSVLGVFSHARSWLHNVGHIVWSTP